MANGDVRQVPLKWVGVDDMTTRDYVDIWIT